MKHSYTGSGNWTLWLLGFTLTSVAAAMMVLPILMFGNNTIEPGEVYLRTGLPDSTMVNEILHHAPNDAGYLMVTILAYDRLVKIDQVGKCEEILQGYEASPEVIPVPVHLQSHEDCFAYRIRFDFPIQGTATTIPLTVAVIHPNGDRHLLQKPDEGDS